MNAQRVLVAVGVSVLLTGSALGQTSGTTSSVEATKGTGVFTASASGCLPSSAPVVEQIETASGVLVDSTKNRHLSFTVGNAGQQQAIRIKVISVPAVFGGWVGSVFWVGVPTAMSELAGKNDSTPPTFQRSLVECEVTDDLFLTDWASRGMIHVTGSQIIPGATYEISVVDKTCDLTTETSFPPDSTVLLGTARWADLVGQFRASDKTWTAPNGAVGIAQDLVAVLDKWKGDPNAPNKSRVDINPRIADGKISFLDVVRTLDAFSGLSYPFLPADPLTPCP